MESLEEIRPSDVMSATKVFVNGEWIGVHREPVELGKPTARHARPAWLLTHAHAHAVASGQSARVASAAPRGHRRNVGGV